MQRGKLRVYGIGNMIWGVWGVFLRLLLGSTEVDLSCEMVEAELSEGS